MVRLNLVTLFNKSRQTSNQTGYWPKSSTSLPQFKAATKTSTKHLDSSESKFFIQSGLVDNCHSYFDTRMLQVSNVKRLFSGLKTPSFDSKTHYRHQFQLLILIPLYTVSNKLASSQDKSGDMSDSSSDSIGAYTKNKIVPRLSSRVSGEDSSPLPADTPIGGRKKKLGDPTMLQRNLQAVSQHFSNEMKGSDDVRDFSQPSDDGPEEKSNSMQLRLNIPKKIQSGAVEPSELAIKKMGSNPFMVATEN